MWCGGLFALSSEAGGCSQRGGLPGSAPCPFCSRSGAVRLSPAGPGARNPERGKERREKGYGAAPRQLTHDEAEEVEADEQDFLAAALSRVVVQRRAAPILALRRDRLVVLVALHYRGRTPEPCRAVPGRAEPSPHAVSRGGAARSPGLSAGAREEKRGRGLPNTTTAKEKKKKKKKSLKKYSSKTKPKRGQNHQKKKKITNNNNNNNQEREGRGRVYGCPKAVKKVLEEKWRGGIKIKRSADGLRGGKKVRSAALRAAGGRWAPRCAALGAPAAPAPAALGTTGFGAALLFREVLSTP